MNTAPEVTEPVVTRISGPIITAVGMRGAGMYEVVQVGDLGLVGEVVRLVGDRATIQVYEDTTMVKPGAPVLCTGAPLTVWLGPGLVGNIYDGIQRPLPGIEAKSGSWIRRGEKVDPLDVDKKWSFEPLVNAGEAIVGGQAIGRVEETPLVTHRIMAPPDISGTVRSIVEKGGLHAPGYPGRGGDRDRTPGYHHGPAVAVPCAPSHLREAPHRRTAHHRAAYHRHLLPHR